MKTKTETAVNVNEKASPTVMSALVAVVISSLLNIGFILMFGTTFGIGFSVSAVIFSSLIISAVFTAIHIFRKKWLSFAATVSTPLLFTACVYFDRFDIKQGLLSTLYYIQLYVLLWLPGDYAEDIEGGRTILAFLIAYSTIAIAITTLVLIRRRWIPAALIFYVPLFLGSVANTDMHPKAAPTLIAGAAVILILLSNAFRKKQPATYGKMLIILTAPVVALMFVLGGIFPQKNYNKDKLAEKILIEMRESIEKAAGHDSFLRDIIERARTGFENTDFDISFDSVSPLHATPTNLSKVGPFNPSSTEVLKVYRESNPDYDGRAPVYGGSVLYLKIESSDHYANNTLSSTKINVEPYEKGAELPNETAMYAVTVTPLRSSAVDVVPYYSDNYQLRGSLPTKLNPYNSTHERIFKFASSNIPVKTGNIYSKKYLEKYVYGTCLEVPYATDRALISSGKLPDWYLDVYYGREQMTDAQKVKYVTEFVRDLHPYDVNTDYPPSGEDFVPWFVKDAKTGICVHYAATSMVLLRMIGIPARYVRGYVDTSSGLDTESTVLASQAHAWFEVFIPEYGWVMGDATPGYGLDETHFNLEAIERQHPEVSAAGFSKDTYENAPSETTTETTTESETETENETSNETANDNTEPEATTATSETTEPPAPEFGLGAGIRAGSDDPTASIPYGPSSAGEGGEGGKTIEKKAFEIPEGLVRAFKTFMKIVIAAVVICFLVLTGRVAFMIYWYRKFKTANINDRIVAYYHYYMLMARVFKVVYPKTVDQTAEKARFSGRELSRKEFYGLVTACKKSLKMASPDFSGYRRALYKLMKMPDVYKIPDQQV